MRLGNYTIYCIYSHLTGALLYVGCSSMMKVRTNRHLADLRGCRHPSRALQCHVDFFGIDDIYFKSIKGASERNYAYLFESYCITKLNPVCNISRKRVAEMMPESFYITHDGDSLFKILKSLIPK